MLQRYSEALRKHESKLVLAGVARRWRWTVGLPSDALIDLVGRLQLGLREAVFNLNKAQFEAGITPQCLQNATLCGTPP